MMPPWSPMILATSASPSPVPDGLVVTNGSNRCGMRSVGTPAPLSSTAISSGRLTRAWLPGTDRRTPGRNEVVSVIWPSALSSPIASAAFLTRLRNTWISLSRLPGTGRERRIVILDDLDLAGEAGQRNLLHVIEHVVDVDRLPLQGPLVAENLHAVDQFADAVRLGADELGQGAVAVGTLAFEQLRRPPDAGERVLDLVSEHGGETGHRAGGAAMGELALDHLRHAALLEHDQHTPRHLRNRAAIKIDELRRLEAEGAQIDAVFVDRGAVPLHLLHESDEGTAEGDHVGERAAAQNARAHLEEIFRGGVGIFDGKPLADDKKRVGQRTEQRVGLDRLALENAPQVGFFGRAAQAVYPLRRWLL